VTVEQTPTVSAHQVRNIVNFQLLPNQRIIQSTPAIFSFKSLTMDVVITVQKVRAPNAGRRSGAPHMYWPHNWWLNQAVT
jgi:hypothetical protein